MCLIAIKPKGVKLTKDFYKSLVRSYYLRNSDGCGFAYKRDNENEKFLYFKKAIYNIDFLINEIKKHKIQPSDELVVHLRKTSGSGKVGINTHPFLMTYKSELLNMTEGYVKHDLLFHNGTFNNFTSVKSNRSDTYNFVKEVANTSHFTSYIKHLLNRNLSVDRIFSENKIVILSLTKNIVINKPIDDKKFYTDENGFIYSNDSFKKQCHSRDYRYSKEYKDFTDDEFSAWEYPHQQGPNQIKFPFAARRGWHAD